MTNLKMIAVNIPQKGKSYYKKNDIALFALFALLCVID